MNFDYVRIIVDKIQLCSSKFWIKFDYVRVNLDAIDYVRVNVDQM
jgi:hypothetical protein